MGHIKVNIYYNSRSVLIESFDVQIDQKIKSIDDARLLIVKHLDDFYSDIVYKINIFKSNDGYDEINLDFEDNIKLKRESTLKSILK
jgi:hypothetical protein